MATLADMIFRIAAELGSRFDLAGAVGSTTQTAPNSEAIRNAITTAIGEYQKQRFRFNEIDPAAPTMFSTVGTRSVYSSADNPVIGTAYYFDYLNIQVGNTLQQLGRVTPERQHLNIQLFNQSGFPASWAYEGNKIILYPVPDQAYNIFIGAHLKFDPPTSDTDPDNVWMNEAEPLIRSRAKYEIAVHVTRSKDMQAAMNPDDGATYRFWKSMKGDTNKVTGLGKFRPMAW